MDAELSNILSLEKHANSEKYDIVYLVRSRPATSSNPCGLQKYYEDIAYALAEPIGCKLVSNIEVDLNPVNESATLWFTIKAPKNNKTSSFFRKINKKKHSALGV